MKVALIFFFSNLILLLLLLLLLDHSRTTEKPLLIYHSIPFSVLKSKKGSRNQQKGLVEISGMDGLL